MKTIKSFLLVLIVSIINSGNSYSKTYYVSTSGSNSNSGLTPATAWKTVSYAASSSSPVVAGDIVYVQAGNYGAENVIFQKSGSPGKPIIFQGYKTTPGDAPPLLVNNSNAYSGFLSTDMPLFDGGNRKTGTGFNCQNQKYIVIKNFQVRNYAYGLTAGSSSQTSAENLTLYNINMMSMGDTLASYSGEGILLGSLGTVFSNNDTITNCMVINSSAEGICVNGDKNMLTGCKIYCNENTNKNAPTDYYLTIAGSYNTVTNCYLERAPGLLHAGHGFSVKSNASQVVDQGLALPTIAPQYNKFYYCTARNMGESFCVRHRTVQYNVFYHCKAIGTHTGAVGSSEGEGNCIITRDGASNNTFDGCIAENCNSGFIFEDTVEDGDTGSNPTGHPGNGNKYINCKIYNCYYGVNYSDYSIQSDAGDNTIAYCTFYKTRYLHYAARHCANMKYIGNIYYGCLPTLSGGYFKGSTYAADIIPNGINTYFKNCDFINIQGGLPANFLISSVGSIAADPLFNDPANLDFTLKSLSPCINTGAFSSSSSGGGGGGSSIYDNIDYDSVPRPQGSGYDMGAYEFKIMSNLSATTSSTNTSCNGANNGSATITPNGGTAPYSYSWSNGQTTANATGLSAGTYTVTVSDVTSASKTYTVTITQPAPLVINNINATYSSCSTGTGEITVTPSGGTAGYSYSWSTSPVQITNPATGLAPGTYSVTVSDAHNCTVIATATVTCSSTTGINNQSSNDENSFSVYPNPSSGPLNVVISDKPPGKEILIVVKDLLGNEFYSKVVVVSNGKEIIAIDNLMSIAPGIYFVIATSDDLYFEKKIVIQ